jgi:hypothetical protein
MRSVRVMTGSSARVLVATRLGGGNAVPVLALARLLCKQRHTVSVLASSATIGAVRRGSLEPLQYERCFPVDESAPFEAQAGKLLAEMAGIDLAEDVAAALTHTRATMVVADCMLPAALSAAEAKGIPTVSVVHFLYGVARRHMVASGQPWAMDLRTLNRTREVLGLAAFADAIQAWERADLVLVTAPAWLDDDAGFPANVVHAGPLGVHATGRSHPSGRRCAAAGVDQSQQHCDAGTAGGAPNRDPRRLRRICRGRGHARYHR